MVSRARFTGLAAAAAAMVLAAVASAQTVQVGSNSSITIHGFFDATAFAQDQKFSFGNGQNAEFPASDATTDKWFGGGDVRNTRLTLGFNGPAVTGDWKVNATLEADFFGGFTATSAFTESQPVPRLRLAFIDFTNGSTTIRIGQQWSPLFGNVPVSVTHIAFPLGYGAAGDIGWRFPGIFLYQNLTGKDAPVHADLQFAVMEGSWNGPSGANLNDYGSAGNATSPQFELRVNVGGKAGAANWTAYVVGHEDQKDLSGAGASSANDQLTGTAVELGGRLDLSGFLFQFNAYTGHSIGQQFAAITQFGKIQSEGGWLQAGYNFTKNWGLYAYYGMDDPKDSDAIAAAGSATPRLKNQMYAGMLRWMSGPLSVGLEYMHDKLTNGPTPTDVKGNQVALSALYSF